MPVHQLSFWLTHPFRGQKEKWRGKHPSPHCYGVNEVSTLEWQTDCFDDFCRCRDEETEKFRLNKCQAEIITVEEEDTLWQKLNNSAGLDYILRGMCRQGPYKNAL